MSDEKAVAALAALAQETRLRIFRLLVTAGPNGLTAGEIAEQLGVVASTLSHHLRELKQAGLLRSTRMERNIIYATDYEGTRRLLAFLVEDCCRGHPSLCGSGFAMPACPPDDPTGNEQEADDEALSRPCCG
ncbi:ArsR/SmtB family transcription factor [Benzoatithermus flavus]|uniref:Metalloregulator ArsR/SmtB family transcription factor n=1 Tax=Benzoatithermus flavus TaxID=3108223 RepID=A0ABU8XN45_9PROT